MLNQLAIHAIHANVNQYVKRNAARNVKKNAVKKTKNARNAKNPNADVKLINNKLFF